MKSFYIIILLFIGTLTQAQIVDIPDANFKDALVNELVIDTNGDGEPDADVDTNDDGEIQVSEAEAVLWLQLTEYNIASLEGIQSFVNLEYLKCDDNQLTSIDTSNNSNLIELVLARNQLSSLDITQNSNLKYFNCSFNQLTSIDITQNPNLEIFICWVNQFTSINLSQNINLEQFFCQENLLTYLDISHNQNLYFLRCNNNLLTGLNIKNGNNIILSDMQAQDNPDLYCIQVDDEEYANNHPVWQKDETASYSEECVFGLEDNTILNFTLFPNPVINILNISAKETINSVSISNVLGQVIYNSNIDALEASIDMSRYANGTYFISVTAGNNTVTKKFIKI